ncbi:hypothetical protein B9T07_04600 [Limnospira fusiformis CCALA 023]|jgi:hypothetical protein|uniref:Uncharacterized protein n=1 Tax=Limnospira platensis NIES-46 TaxID=1236695 RepID=A0A5M3TDR6_LIMPL|nr:MULTISPECIES: hypothetical protein [Arthrospira]AMW30487.1 hypothetical protein AP285_23660 [Arthrospira platensis YZ]KDR58355.1 hypothetical protein APPUASWS_005485 [Arthrospira platensis str. Paraca]BAI93181.1 hypothetical protein NIES39_N00640 [Arthrospira platensis NIES-39]MBS0017632.1 hypothetical protein [Arthrospira sp. SH-MAG29]TVU53736.1 MAG: hypothetical protein EA414_10315 [Arthrospira sp. PLM2.Bin9]
MLAQFSPSSNNLDALIERIFVSRKITREDQKQLMYLLLSKECLSDEEHDCINEVFDRLRRGLLHVVE